MYPSKRKRNYKAQRPYQKTRYRIPNVLTPDELVMKVKWNNYVIIHKPTELPRLEYPVNGARYSELLKSHNFNENAGKFKQVEFLSGKLSFYVINQAEFEADNYRFPHYMMVGNYSARRWVDENLEHQTEAIIPKPESANKMWEEIAEIPGYQVRLVNYLTSGNAIQKIAFKASKASFKTLKANPTGFQVNLPITYTDQSDIFPTNAMTGTIDLAVVGDDWSDQFNETVVLVSRTILVRFKGARTK